MTQYLKYIGALTLLTAGFVMIFDSLYPPAENYILVFGVIAVLLAVGYLRHLLIYRLEQIRIQELCAERTVDWYKMYNPTCVKDGKIVCNKCDSQSITGFLETGPAIKQPLSKTTAQAYHRYACQQCAATLFFTPTAID